jgi:putative sterol carrier protein
MDMQACTDALRAKVGDSSGLNAVLKFDCGADGVAVIDGRAVPNNLSALMTGDLEPTTGFMMGKFKVSGDMSVALKLQRVV